MTFKDADWGDKLIGLGFFFAAVFVVLALAITVGCKLTNSGPWSPEAYRLEAEHNNSRIIRIRHILSDDVEKSDPK